MGFHKIHKIYKNIQRTIFSSIYGEIVIILFSIEPETRMIVNFKMRG